MHKILIHAELLQRLKVIFKIIFWLCFRYGHRCSLCDRCFGQQTNLDRHLKKHESDGPTILDEDRKRYHRRAGSVQLQQSAAQKPSAIGEKINSIVYPPPFYYDLGRVSMMQAHASPILNGRLALTSPSHSSSSTDHEDGADNVKSDDAALTIDEEQSEKQVESDDGDEPQPDKKDGRDQGDSQQRPIDIEEHSMPCTESSGPDQDTIAHSFSCGVTICTEKQSDDEPITGATITVIAPSV